MASKNMDWVLVVLALLAGVFAGALFFPTSNVVYTANYTCPSCTSFFGGENKIGVVYLEPPACQECNTSRVNMVVSATGVSFVPLLNDGIQSPSILLTKGNISTIARATNDFNIIHVLCIAGNTEACAFEYSMKQQMEDCLEQNEIALDSIVYLYSDWCGSLCSNMNKSLIKLEDAGYNVLAVNVEEISAPRVCMDAFFNYAGGYPQLLCPKKVLSNTGALDYNSLEQFALDCTS